MLRAVVLLMILANVAWWAVAQGWLPSGWLPWARPDLQREPQRLALQQRPETIQILPATADRAEPPAAARPASSDTRDEAGADSGETATTCLEAGPFAAAQWPGAEAVLEAQGLPATAWRRVAVSSPASASVEGDRLRVPAADEALRARLLALQDGRLGDGFRDCR